MNISNILALLALLGTVVAAAWKVYDSLAKKIDNTQELNDLKIKRVYERQDEEITRIEKEYTRVDVHNASIDHMKEIIELKSNATVQLFNANLTNLTKSVNDLLDRVNHK